MSETMDPMMTVGEIDTRIFELTLKLRRIPNSILEAKRQLDAEQAVLDEVLIPWSKLDHEINEREATIKVALDTIEKFEEHMKQVTTQKEYIAARKQVDEARKLNSRLQDEILERRIQQDELTPRLEERRGTHGKVLESFQKEESTLLRRQSDLEKEIAKLAAKVEKELRQIGSNAFDFYKRLVKGNKLPAVVAVVAGTCGGCNMALPPQVYNMLLSRTEQLFTCPTCNRLIYNQPAEETPQEAQPLADAAAG